MSDVDHDEPELDAGALAMLRAYRDEERIPAPLHERVWSRVQADVEPPRGQWLRYAAVAGGLAAAALAVLWLGGRALRSEPPPPASQAGYERSGGGSKDVVEPRTSERAMPAAHEAHEDPAPPPSPTLAPGGSTPGAAEPAASSASATAAEASPARSRSDDAVRRGTAESDRQPAAPVEPELGSTLAAENRLVAKARAALVEAKPEQALARLDEHARRFPDGVLSEEREALRAVALCEAGRDADGDAAAHAFLREHPQAALAERVRSACLE